MDTPYLRSPLLQIGVMFFIMGFQSILMGLIAELLARTYHESQQKPTYTIRKAINISETKKQTPLNFWYANPYPEQ